MTLPKAISDAIDEYRNKLRGGFRPEFVDYARAALERAIADHADVGKAADWQQATEEMDAAQVPATSFVNRVRWLLAHRVKDMVPPSVEESAQAYAVSIAAHLRGASTIFTLRSAWASLAKAIADHVADAGKMVPPTEAEIEEALDAVNNWGHMPPGAEAIERFDEVEAMLRALMRRAAAATPAPSALERLRERVDAAASYEAIEMGEWRAFDWVLDWIDEEREREAKR
jgi:hypothetical protein